MNAPAWLVAGIGCRQGCELSELSGLLEHALALAGANRSELRGLATFEKRRREPGLLELASGLNLPLAAYTAALLTPFDAMLSYRSAISWRHTGCHGVAEGAALAHCQALSAQPSRLLITRQCSRHATVALAST